MIIDLKKFISEERGYWTELETFLDRMEKSPEDRMDMVQVKRFHYLYQRTSAGLAKLTTFSAEVNIRQYLESLVGRAYGEIHETRDKAHRFSVSHWFFRIFPRIFRKHIFAFRISLAITLAGCIFGGAAVCLDPDAKEVLMPFSHLQGNPSERVKAEEEGDAKDRLENAKTSFSSQLMTHNTRVSILALALGITWGIGTIILLFYNGVILGAVAADYILAGETEFLMGWLLPHGAIEIPAIILAGQAGLVLASALIGWGKPVPAGLRFRKISADLMHLISGVAVMLVWAGFVEAFLSQYHEPVIPYFVKIGFGSLELGLLALFLSRAGVEKQDRTDNLPESYLP